MPAELPEAAIVEEKFLAASGPGGQNVNKVATAVQLRIDVFRLGLPPYAYTKFKELAGSRMTAGGELVITARKFRTQEANRQDARERVIELITKAYERDARRVKTKPSKAARARRVDEKKGRAQIKAGRGKVRVE
ncbi:alternative ribosome rescue aminoacyl-tRNA hydrolase ArfB [Sphingomonas koreensis]